MRIKKAGSKVFGAVLTTAEKKAMNMEINRQIVEAWNKERKEPDETEKH